MSSSPVSDQGQVVNTRIGKLSFELGLPAEDTVTELFDAFDFQRACEAYVWRFHWSAWRPGNELTIRHSVAKIAMSSFRPFATS